MFLPSAKIIVKDANDDKKILLIKRNVEGNISYEPAGGRAEIDHSTLYAESLEECVKREAQEELGVSVIIEHYVGSYTYFWPHDTRKCSSYAVFIGKVEHNIENFTGNGDKDCWPVEPAWVTYDDIVDNKIIINPTHKGLKELILKSLEL